MRQAFHTHKRHTSTKQPRTQKKVQKQLGVDSSQSSRPQSRHKQNRNQAHQSRGHSRHPASQHPIKSYKFTPSANTSLLKSFLRNSIQTPTQRQTEQKVLNSSLYKKLLQELQNMKKNYSKQITDLRSQIIELDQQIVNEKDNLLALIRKRQKMEKDVNKFTDQLVQLQQKNYQMYWDVAARMNQEEPESYEELLELEEEAGYVSRGLSEEEIDKLIRKWSKSRKVGKKQKLNQSMNPEQPQSCCICCHNLEQKDETCSLPCGHNHHNSCIKEWLLINKVCPLCRKEVKG